MFFTKKRNIDRLKIIILASVCFMNNTNAKLFILIGPSGAGKSTLIEKLAQAGIKFEPLVTHTTRSMRAKEVHGKDYFFIINEEFNNKKAKNEFILPINYNGNQYGTCKNYLKSKLQSNCNLVCALTGDVAKQMNDIVGGNVVTIFISPPSINDLEKRLLARKTETQESLNSRLNSAVIELESQDSFDYKIINDDVDFAAEQFKKIFEQETNQ